MKTNIKMKKLLGILAAIALLINTCSVFGVFAYDESECDNVFTFSDSSITVQNIDGSGYK